MPYVTQDSRKCIDSQLHDLIEEARLVFEPDEMKGVANYLVTRLVLGLLKPEDGWRYSSLADVVGTLEAAKLEVYRRLVAPYEDGAIDKNGDLDEYKPTGEPDGTCCCCCDQITRGIDHS